MGIASKFIFPLFGLSCPPWAFTNVMKSLIALLRVWGIITIIYVGNMMESCMGHSIAFGGVLVPPGSSSGCDQQKIASIPNPGVGVPWTVGELVD